MRIKKKMGSAIFEILIVVSVIAIVITGVVAASTVSIKNSLHARYQAEATRRAQELTEWIRNSRNTETWDSFKQRASSAGTKFCIGDNMAWTSASCTAVNKGSIAETPFERTVKLTLYNDNSITADVFVTWTDSTGTHQSRVSTRFTNWNK